MNNRKQVARKLSPDEAAVLSRPVHPSEQRSAQEEQIRAEKLTVQHDTAMLLSPESRAWFGVEIPAGPMSEIGRIW